MFLALFLCLPGKFPLILENSFQLSPTWETSLSNVSAPTPILKELIKEASLVLPLCPIDNFLLYLTQLT